MTLEIEILYEDEKLIAVNKPNNMLVHHSYYARNIEEKSLLQWLRIQTEKNFYPINRIDRKTSGIVLLAKEKEHVSLFQELFTDKTITKIYYALVRGHILENQSINSPVKNEKGNYKDAESKIKPLELFTLNIPVKPYPTSRYTFLEMSPVTGRTHQLRIHANKIAHPIIGDHKYGNRHHNQMFEQKLSLPNLFLHCKELKFFHPEKNETIEINAPMPDFWENCFSKFRLQAVTDF